MGVVIEAFKRAGHPIPDPADLGNYDPSGVRHLEALLVKLPRLDVLKPFDILHLRTRRQHVAIVEDSRYALHTNEEQVVRSRLADLIGARTVAYRLGEWA